jgi:hypothetical protein
MLAPRVFLGGGAVKMKNSQRETRLRKRRGAPNKSPVTARLIEKRWTKFFEARPSYSREDLFPTFLHTHGRWMSDALGRKITSYTAFRNMLAIANKQRAVINENRRRSWKILGPDIGSPAGRSLSTSAYLRWAGDQALLMAHASTVDKPAH